MKGTKRNRQFLVMSIIGLISGSAFAQTVPAPRKSTKSTLAAPPPAESAEHKAAVQTHDRIATDCDAKLKESAAQVEAARGDRDRLEIEITYDNAIKKACAEGLAAAAEGVEHVDGCLAVYRKTIDKRTSDLTTRETGQISECKSLDLYPPQVKPR